MADNRKRGERMCDKLIRLGPNTDLAARVRRAEKFTFDDTTTTRIYSAIRSAPPSIIEAVIPDLAILPFRNCWFEWHITTSADPNLKVHEGFLFEADETFQRGTIWNIGTRQDGSIGVPDYEMTFNFTREFDDTTSEGGLPDGIVPTEQFDLGNIEDAAISRICSRFTMLSFPDTRLAAAHRAYAELMQGSIWCELLGFMILNLPKEEQIIDVVKEDLTDYNRQRRRLGQPKSQRQSYHIVTINTTRNEPSEDLAAILAKQVTERGTHASPGEHDVRGHYRTYHRGTPSEFRIWIEPFKRGEGPCISIKRGYQVVKKPSRRSALTEADISRMRI